MFLSICGSLGLVLARQSLASAWLGAVSLGESWQPVLSVTCAHLELNKKPVSSVSQPLPRPNCNAQFSFSLWHVAASLLSGALSPPRPH